MAGQHLRATLSLCRDFDYALFERVVFGLRFIFCYAFRVDCGTEPMLNTVSRDFLADQPLDNGRRLDVSCLQSGAPFQASTDLRAISVLLVMLAHRNAGRLLNVLVAICLAAFVWRCIMVGLGAPQRYTYAATDARLDSIAYGCITSLILWRHSNVLARFLRYLWLALPLGLSIILASLLIRSPAFRETLRYSLQGVALSLIFLGLFTSAGRKVTTLLDAPAMRWMGRMSYAAYLWHLEPLYIFRYFLGADIATSSLGMAALVSIVGCGATFSLAALSHRYVYRPVLAVRRRFGSHAAA